MRRAASTGGSSLRTGRRPSVLDPVVERSHALHGAVCDALGERAVARPAPRLPWRRLCRHTRPARTRAGRPRTQRGAPPSPRSCPQAAKVVLVRHRPPALRLHDLRHEASILHPRPPHRHPSTVELGLCPDVRRQRADAAQALLRIRGEIEVAVRRRELLGIRRSVVGLRPERRRSQNVVEQVDGDDGGTLIDVSGVILGADGKRPLSCDRSASRSSVSRMIVTPVSSSPARIARSTGAAPRQRGSSGGAR